MIAKAGFTGSLLFCYIDTTISVRALETRREQCADWTETETSRCSCSKYRAACTNLTNGTVPMMMGPD